MALADRPDEPLERLGAKAFRWMWNAFVPAIAIGAVAFVLSTADSGARVDERIRECKGHIAELRKRDADIAIRIHTLADKVNAFVIEHSNQNSAAIAELRADIRGLRRRCNDCERHD